MMVGDRSLKFVSMGVLARRDRVGSPDLTSDTQVNKKYQQMVCNEEDELYSFIWKNLSPYIS